MGVGMGRGGGGSMRVGSLQCICACKYVLSTVPIIMMSNRFKFDIIITYVCWRQVNMKVMHSKQIIWNMHLALTSGSADIIRQAFHLCGWRSPL